MIRALFLAITFNVLPLFALGEVGTTAASFNLKDLDSASHSLYALRGKVVFLFLFGGGCPTCIGEAPKTEAFYQRYKGQGVQVLGLEVWNYTRSQVLAYKNNTGVTYPLLLMAGYLKASYGVGYNTGYFVIDPQGVIRYGKNADYSTFDSVRVDKVVDSLLATLGTGREGAAPAVSSLKLIFPNPYHPGAKIRLDGYSGPAPSISFFDPLGRAIAAPSAPGAYLLRVTAPNLRLQRRIVLAP